MRRFLLLFLAMSILVLPLRGLAGQQVQELPCPTAHGAASPEASGGHKCCNAADVAHRSGHPCKSGQECKVDCQVSLTESIRRGDVPQPYVPAAAIPFFPRSFLAHAVWRPPSIG